MRLISSTTNREKDQLKLQRFDFSEFSQIKEKKNAIKSGKQKIKLCVICDDVAYVYTNMCVSMYF